MKKQSVIKSMKFSLLGAFLLSLTACAPSHTVKHPIHSLESDAVSFYFVDTYKVEDGIKVSGDLRKRIAVGTRKMLLGHVHINLNDKNGQELETILARIHHKYGKSRSWHFNGVLKTPLPEGSEIVVMYHKTHSKY